MIAQQCTTIKLLPHTGDKPMMTKWHGNALHIICYLWGKSVSRRWISLTKANNVSFRVLLVVRLQKHRWTGRWGLPRWGPLFGYGQVVIQLYFLCSLFCCVDSGWSTPRNKPWPAIWNTPVSPLYKVTMVDLRGGSNSINIFHWCPKYHLNDTNRIDKNIS